MFGNPAIRIVLLSTALGWAANSSAETRRLAIVVGNNAGSGERAPLHYAEVDAGKMARVLAELGGVDPADLFLLQGQHRENLVSVFEHAKETVVRWHSVPGTRVVLLFYFSGHSDGEALELGLERLPFAELRTWLDGTGADVRLAIVDSCKSGALLASKGGTPGPAFQIRLFDDLASTGEALLTSSAADEVALESKEIGGSFFTHHFVSGLRGAADSSGDGVVTLTEAYQYAFSRTVSATASSTIGAQHPTYDYRLSGQGELILTELYRPNALLELPAGYERVLVRQIIRDQYIAEVPSGAPLRIAVTPGEYSVHAWKDGRVYRSNVTIAPGEHRRLNPKELSSGLVSSGQSKGESAPAGLVAGASSLSPREPTTDIIAAFGAQAAVARKINALFAARLGLRSASPSGLALSVDFATGSGNNNGVPISETNAAAYLGYRMGLQRGYFKAFIGVEGGIGLAVQGVSSVTTVGSNGFSVTRGSQGAAASFSLAPWAGVSIGNRPVWFLVECHTPFTFLSKYDGSNPVFLPSGWAGAALSF